MTEAAARLHLRRQLEAHLASLGYSGVPLRRTGVVTPEVVRVNPVRGRSVYGETVLRGDLRRRSCQERLILFSRRRTRHHVSILFFIAIPEEDAAQLDKLLAQLEIRSGTRGDHVRVVPIAMEDSRSRRPKGSQAAAR